jgi:hypothetical protein
MGKDSQGIPEEAFALEEKGIVRDTGPSFFQKAEQPETVLSARKD